MSESKTTTVQLPLVVPENVSQSVDRLMTFAYAQFDSFDEIPSDLFDDLVRVDEWLGVVRMSQVRIHRVGLIILGLTILVLFFLPELIVLGGLGGSFG